ncbi:MAG: ABC transporter permease [bacterium]
MKFREIFRFEFGYQVRRVLTWLYFTILVIIAFLFVRGSFLADALYADFYLNSPFVIAAVTVFGSLFGFLLTAAVAGQAGARDVATGMHPLTYTAPVSKAAYLGGRFLAAFALNAMIHLAVPVGILLAVYAPGVDAEVIGPFRLVAYLTAYGFIALPNAFVGTTIQFAWAALGRQAMMSYLGSVLLFFVAYGGIIAVNIFLEQQRLAMLLDVFAHVTITSDLILGWTPIEKNTRLLALEGLLLRSRILWFGIALATLAFTYVRFRFAHHTARAWWSRIGRRPAAHAPTPAGVDGLRSTFAVPHVPRTFGFAVYALQLRTIAWTSFWTIAKSHGGLVLFTVIATLAVVVMPPSMHNMGTPLLPRTEYVLTFLTAPLTGPFTPWVIIPLLIILYAGELVWRERKAGLGEMSDAAPVPEGVLLSGKFLGLGLLLVVWMAMLTIAGVLVQLRMGYHDYEIGLFLHVLFGLQLPEYLLFALLAIVVQAVVGHKYIGHLVALLVYVLIVFAPWLGIGHHLLVYGSTPAWTYTDMRGFGPSLGPWRWFMGYWAAWALLLAVMATLFWVRGKDGAFGVRLRMARRRFTRATAMITVAAAGLILLLGGFIFYNTNVLNGYSTASEWVERRAEYERRYKRFKDSPQPHVTAINLHVDIHPERRAVDLRCTYHLVNGTPAAIDSVHLATIRSVRTGAITFDRPATLAIADDDHGHRTYVLAVPLQPGDSLQLDFEVQVEPHGFSNGGIDPAVTANSTYFKNEDWLPAISYQPRRELISAADRRKQGLPPRPLIPSLDDAGASEDITGEAHDAETGADGIAFEAVVSTSEDQIAVAPGVLRRTWTEAPSAGSGQVGRRYFHYATDVPIGDEHAFFSAPYAVHEEQWIPPSGTGHPVAIQVHLHPAHAANLERMLRSVRASLNYYSRAFGPYPWSNIRLVENPGRGIGAHAEPAMINYTEGFSRFDPTEDPQGLDLPFAVMAHEIAHQWWGAQLSCALVEGAGLLTESAAWYSGMGVVEETYGRAHLRRLLRFFRQPYPIPPIRQSVPLLRGRDPYAAYRKGPFALFAMSEYMGKERVNLAYRRLLEAHRSGTLPLPTSLDLYRELKAVTPDSLQTLLHDLFEANTFWELETERPTALKTEAGAWQVTIPVHARKVVVDPAGVETEVPMDEWVQIGVFAPTEEGPEFGETLYLQMHRIRSGEQTITVTVPREPADAGIDPYHLLIDLERFDNVEEVKIER